MIVDRLLLARSKGSCPSIFICLGHQLAAHCRVWSSWSTGSGGEVGRLYLLGKEGRKEEGCASFDGKVNSKEGGNRGAGLRVALMPSAQHLRVPDRVPGVPQDVPWDGLRMHQTLHTHHCHQHHNCRCHANPPHAGVSWKRCCSSKMTLGGGGQSLSLTSGLWHTRSRQLATRCP